jgi:hypothetical protein
MPSEVESTLTIREPILPAAPVTTAFIICHPHKSATEFTENTEKTLEQ